MQLYQDKSEPELLPPSRRPAGQGSFSHCTCLFNVFHAHYFSFVFPVIIISLPVQTWYIPCSCPDSMFKSDLVDCTDPWCSFKFFVGLKKCLPRPDDPTKAFLPAVSADGERFLNRNCSRATMVQVFRDAASKLQFSPKRLARVTNYSARRTFTTLTLQVGCHPQKIALGTKHKKPSNKVATTFEYLNADLCNFLCAPTVMALIAKRFRFLLCNAQTAQATGHNTRLFDDQGSLMHITDHQIRAVITVALFSPLFASRIFLHVSHFQLFLGQRVLTMNRSLPLLPGFQGFI